MKIDMSQAMRKCVFMSREQQRRRSACTSVQFDQRLCCSLLRQYNISRFYSRNFKTLASFCRCGVWPGRKLPKTRIVVSWFNYVCNFKIEYS